jgi:hypothetical protein
MASNAESKEFEELVNGLKDVSPEVKEKLIKNMDDFINLAKLGEKRLNLLEKLGKQCELNEIKQSSFASMLIEKYGNAQQQHDLSDIRNVLREMNKKINLLQSNQKKKKVSASVNGTSAAKELSESWAFKIKHTTDENNLLITENVFKDEDYKKTEHDRNLLVKLENELKKKGVKCQVYDVNTDLLYELFVKKGDKASEMVENWDEFWAKPDAVLCFPSKDLTTFNSNFAAKEKEECKEAANEKKSGKGKITKALQKRVHDKLLRQRNQLIARNIGIMVDTKSPREDKNKGKYVDRINDGQATCEVCLLSAIIDEVGGNWAPLVFEASMIDDNEDFAVNRGYYFTRNELDSSGNNASNNASNNDNMLIDIDSKQFILNMTDVSSDVMISWMKDYFERFGKDDVNFGHVDNGHGDNGDIDIDVDVNADVDNESISMTGRNQDIIAPNDDNDVIDESNSIPPLPDIISVFGEIKASRIHESI